MRLVYEKTGTEVKVGDVVTLRDGDEVKVTSIQPPHKPSSTGRVTVQIAPSDTEMSYFPAVIGAHWIEREDQR